MMRFVEYLTATGQLTRESDAPLVPPTEDPGMTEGTFAWVDGWVWTPSLPGYALPPAPALSAPTNRISKRAMLARYGLPLIARIRRAQAGADAASESAFALLVPGASLQYTMQAAQQVFDSLPEPGAVHLADPDYQQQAKLFVALGWIDAATGAALLAPSQSHEEV